MKKRIIRQIALLIITMLFAIHGYTAIAEGAATTATTISPIQGISTENSKEENLCIKADDMNNITAVIEEPLDFTTATGNEGTESAVRDCVRISVCTVRNQDATNNAGSVQCVSTLNKADFNFTNPNPKTFTVTYNPVQVFISKSGVDMLYLYIGAIYRWGASIIGVIAVLVIVISGIQISAAGGEQAAVTSAKTRITQSLIGIVILFLSGIILYTINPTFFTAAT